MKRLSLIISAIIFSSISLSAQIIETVYTTKGDIYEGFISEQNPGKYIIVYAEKAILSAPKAEVSNLRKEYRPDNTLTYTAIRFLEEKSVQSDALFYTFEYNGQIIDNVYVLEDNDEQIKSDSDIDRYLWKIDKDGYIQAVNDFEKKWRKSTNKTSK